MREVDGRPVVFVLREGKVERRSVEPGEDRLGDVEVLAGLFPGEQVVVHGPARLEDGQRAKVK